MEVTTNGSDDNSNEDLCVTCGHRHELGVTCAVCGHVGKAQFFAKMMTRAEQSRQRELILLSEDPCCTVDTRFGLSSSPPIRVSLSADAALLDIARELREEVMRAMNITACSSAAVDGPQSYFMMKVGDAVLGVLRFSLPRRAFDTMSVLVEHALIDEAWVLPHKHRRGVLRTLTLALLHHLCVWWTQSGTHSGNGSGLSLQSLRVLMPAVLTMQCVWLCEAMQSLGFVCEHMGSHLLFSFPLVSVHSIRELARRIQPSS